MTKQTGSALIVLLVSLLISCAPSSADRIPPQVPQLEPQKVCISVERYLELAPIVNEGAFIVKLDPRDTAVFQYNYNNTVPKTEFQISNVVFSMKSDTPYTLVAIFMGECLVVETPIISEWIANMMKPMESI